jgi:hypothetical protein
MCLGSVRFKCDGLTDKQDGVCKKVQRSWFGFQKRKGKRMEQMCNFHFAEYLLGYPRFERILCNHSKLHDGPFGIDGDMNRYLPHRNFKDLQALMECYLLLQQFSLLSRKMFSSQ